MRIDVHTHFLPPALFDLYEAAGAARQLESYSVFGPMLRGSSERLFASGTGSVIDGWIQEMDESGIDLAVLSLGALQPYFPDGQRAAAMARRVNVMFQEAVERGGGRLAAFGSVPLPHGRAAVKELQFCLDECSFAGVSLGTSAGGRPLDAAEFKDLWAELNAREAVAFIHPGTTPAMGVGAGDYHLAPDFCSPTETALALCRLVVSRITTRYPDVRVVAAAFGGSLPFFAHRFDAGMRRSHPDLYEQIGGVLSELRRFWYDTSMLDEPTVFRSVRESLGVERLVFGSDVPRGPWAEAIDSVAISPWLTDAEKSDILDLNGATVLNIRQPAAAPGAGR